MKKSLLFILASLIAIFALTGCADEPAKEEGPKVTLIDPTVAGTYEVQFFGSQVKAKTPNPLVESFYVTNDCAKAKQLLPDVIGVGGKNNCTTSSNSKILDGKVVITVDETGMLIVSRLQMEGGTVDMSAADKYQYTEYNKTANVSGQGVKGWNYDEKTSKPSTNPTDFPNSPFSIEPDKSDKSVLHLNMTLVGKVVLNNVEVDAINTIILKKVSDSTNKLENKIQKPFTK